MSITNHLPQVPRCVLTPLHETTRIYHERYRSFIAVRRPVRKPGFADDNRCSVAASVTHSRATPSQFALFVPSRRAVTAQTGKTVTGNVPVTAFGWW